MQKFNLTVGKRSGLPVHKNMLLVLKCMWRPWWCTRKKKILKVRCFQIWCLGNWPISQAHATARGYNKKDIQIRQKGAWRGFDADETVRLVIWPGIETWKDTKYKNVNLMGVWKHNHRAILSSQRCKLQLNVYFSESQKAWWTSCSMHIFCKKEKVIYIYIYI